MTVAGAAQADLTRQARSEGMQTLREDGVAKVNRGITSIAEVARSRSRR